MAPTPVNPTLLPGKNVLLASIVSWGIQNRKRDDGIRSWVIFGYTRDQIKRGRYKQKQAAFSPKILLLFYYYARMADAYWKLLLLLCDLKVCKRM